jgi:cysteine synthase A
MVAAVKGYPIIFTMPETMSVERRMILQQFGATLILTPADRGMVGAVMEAQELADSEKYFMPQQFENDANPEAHRKTTAQEIIHDLKKRHLDYFVAGVGTGGTITGAGEVLKAHYEGMKVIAVEPADSPVLSQGKAGPHKIQGIGAGFVPCVLNTKIYDRIITVSNDQAIEAARDLAKLEGILGGISAGAACYVAVELSKLPENAGKTIVFIMCDTGERYLSTELYAHLDA